MDNINRQAEQPLSDNLQAGSSSSSPPSVLLNPFKSTKRSFYKCATCDYKTDRSRDLKRHNKRPCKGLKVHRCEFCDYKTSIPYELKRHTKKFHDLVWKCHYCDFVTDDFNVLLYQHHKRAHLGLPFSWQTKSPRGNGDHPQLVIDESPNNLESVLETVEPALHPIYKASWESIRSISYEPKNYDNKYINHAYYRIRHTPDTDWASELKKIFTRQSKKFKLNYAHSLILYNRDTTEYRFWHGSRGHDRVLEIPINVFSYNDLSRVLRSINTHDMWRWASHRKSSSVWSVAAITSTTFFIDRLHMCMGTSNPSSKNEGDHQDTVVYKKYKPFSVPGDESDSDSDESDIFL